MYKKLRRNAAISIIDPDYAVIEHQLEYMSRFTQNRYRCILDYGAGNSPYKSSFNFDGYITADIEQNRSENIDIIVDKNNPVIDLKSESVDLILCMDVLEHVYDDKKILKMLLALLEQGGTMMLSLPFLYREHEYPYDYRRYTSSGIRALLAEAGFSDIQVTKIGNPFFVAWNVCYERQLKNYERDETGFVERIMWKIVNRTILPILNCTLFKTKCKEADGIFSRMLVIARKL